MTDKTRTQADKVRDWWRQFDTGASPSSEIDGKADRNTRTNRAGAAQLRRAASPIEYMLVSETVDLVDALGVKKPEKLSRVAELAHLLAHVRTDDPGHTMAAMLGKRSTPGDMAVMSSVRFRRLMLAEDGAERVTQFRRAIVLLKGTVNVKDLAGSWLSWDDPKRGERIRMKWVFDYSSGGITSAPETTREVGAPSDRGEE